jgi:hypothetical protein
MDGQGSHPFLPYHVHNNAKAHHTSYITNTGTLPRDKIKFYLHQSLTVTKLELYHHAFYMISRYNA